MMAPDDYLAEEFCRLETVEVEELVFELGPALRALLEAGRVEAAEAFLQRPALASAWEVVWQGVRAVVTDDKGEMLDEVAVPGLLEYVCLVCGGRHKASSLRIRRELDAEGRFRYTAVCRELHLLPWLYRRLAP